MENRASTSAAKPLPSLEELTRLFHYCPETGELSWRVNRGKAKAGGPAGTYSRPGDRSGRSFMLCVSINYKRHSVGRIAWKMATGQDPGGFDVGHLDGNIRNNALDNLTLIRRGEKLRKRPKRMDPKVRRLLAELAEWVDDETRTGEDDASRHELVIRAREVLGAEPRDVVRFCLED